MVSNSTTIDDVPKVVHVILQTLLGFGTIFGTFGNIITIIAARTTRSLHSTPNVYVVNLAICDSLVCAIIMPLSALSYNVKIPDLFCKLIGYPNLMFLQVSVLNLGLVALNRYILVCHSRDTYSTIYVTRNVALTVFGSWAIPAVLFTTPFFGFGNYGYNIKFGACIFMAYDTTSYWFIFTMADCIIIFPTLFLTLYCYVKIMTKFKESKSKIQGGNTTVAQSSSNDNDPTKSLKTG